MDKQFLEQTTLISYAPDTYSKDTFNDINDIVLSKTPDGVQWLNTYGLHFQSSIKKVIKNNELDDFLLKLITDSEHPNKVITLDDSLFVGVKVLKTESTSFETDQLIFIVSSSHIWSIQEKKGDYFEWIRERLVNNTGIVRKKKTDYLLFLILESIIDNYKDAYDKNIPNDIHDLDPSQIKPTPEFTGRIESRKRELFILKKACISLRDTILKLEKITLKDMKKTYYAELKEQANNLIADIDSEAQELESKINLIFSIQGHRLNEVMKTLTIFSVIFIPLTFMAGIYGMNFKNMPELETQNGYFILLGAMVLITLCSVWYFMRKKWF